MSADRIKTEAEALRLALLSELATPQDVIRWADRTIAEEPTPHVSIIDLALAVKEGAERLALRLVDVPGDGSLSAAIRLLLKVLLQRLDSTAHPREVAESLYRLSRTAQWPEDEFGTEPYWLDDLFQPEMAFGGVYYRDALAALREYLTKHAENIAGRFSPSLIAFQSFPLQSAPTDRSAAIVRTRGWAEQSYVADSSWVSPSIHNETIQSAPPITF